MNGMISSKPKGAVQQEIQVKINHGRNQKQLLKWNVKQEITVGISGIPVGISKHKRHDA